MGWARGSNASHHCKAEKRCEGQSGRIVVLKGGDRPLIAGKEEWSERAPPVTHMEPGGATKAQTATDHRCIYENNKRKSSPRPPAQTRLWDGDELFATTTRFNTLHPLVVIPFRFTPGLCARGVR